VEELSPAPVETVTVEPLPLRAAAPLLPGSRPLDKLEAYAVLGGLPRVLNRIDRGVTTGTNLRRLILHPSGSLSEAGADFLERDLQTPPRYNAIMLALSRGETDWGGVHAGVPDLSRSGQVAPYIARLAQLGLVVGRRSLDASAASRSTRYAIADPFLAFWFRFVLPYRHGLRESESDYHARVIRPGMADHLQRIFPAVCRQHMRFDAIETMGANARENGSLWGTDYDLPIAGLLTSGAAYYGTCAWSYDERSAAPIAEIEHGMRESRYGFGRERRVRLVFTGLPAPRSLRREVARNREALLIDADALLGA
jgi:hypothetical protein